MSDPAPGTQTGELIIEGHLCQGHGRCYSLFPMLFEPGDDDGKARVLVSHVEGQQHADALRAVGECPERAIAVRPRS